jgi:hypothetical protein
MTWRATSARPYPLVACPKITNANSPPCDRNAPATMSGRKSKLKATIQSSYYMFSLSAKPRRVQHEFQAFNLHHPATSASRHVSPTAGLTPTAVTTPTLTAIM